MRAAGALPFALVLAVLAGCGGTSPAGTGDADPGAGLPDADAAQADAARTDAAGPDTAAEVETDPGAPADAADVATDTAPAGDAADAPDALPPDAAMPDPGPVATPGCPVCSFTMKVEPTGPAVADGDAIPPLWNTDLRLQDTSVDSGIGAAGITVRTWTVDAPPGSTADFFPSATFPEPRFQPVVIGTYTFRLHVENAVACADDCAATVRVDPQGACYVELTWTTPGDPDPTDVCPPTGNCGTDLDLHVLHPDPSAASGFAAYFDADGDCYWGNAHPVWDLAHPDDPAHQPVLDSDDTDGTGPEAWTYAIPEDGLCYRIGVHLFDDHSLGVSYPTVRVFTGGATPVFQKTLAEGLSMLDLWEVGEVCCTNAAAPFQEYATPQGGPVVLPNVLSPYNAD